MVVRHEVPLRYFPILSQIQDSVYQLNLTELHTDIEAHINQEQWAQKEQNVQKCNEIR